ncbi:MAG TPA: TAXI family TRAP transporter solute-binding subunit, partial [Stellaceae bacterium]|nr:TAXI family TRAP transporter solute-binding subunit [Stellaceae bacterium]
IGVSARKLADEQIVIAGRQVRATRYTLITPYLAGSIWYDEESLWVRGPGAMYAGNPDDVPTIGTQAVLVTSSDQPDELAYGVVKAVLDNFADFRRLHPALSTLDIKDMVLSQAVVPIHPGALTYFRGVCLVH